MTAILFVTYDGVLEPLGESQVVAYLEGLAVAHRVTLLSFEKPADLQHRSRVDALAARLEQRGITWIALRYHKWPSAAATAWDVAHGIWRGRRAARRHPFDIVHARSYVPALIALGCRWGTRPARFLFDMRGFWIDEKVEAGHWPADSWLTRLARRCERRFLRDADAVVSLTETGIEVLTQPPFLVKPATPLVVIPTCADLTRFSPGPKDPALLQALQLAGSRVIGCVGTMGNWYLREPMLRYLALLAGLPERLKILIVTRDDHAALRRDAEAMGLASDRLVLVSAPFAEMPRYIRLMDAGLFFISPSRSKKGSAATKLAEFLGCGVPVIINDGVGDSGRIVRADGVGVVLPDVEPPTLAGSIDEMRAMLADPSMAGRCRASAEARFDLAKGVEQYRALYARLVAAR